MAVFALIAAEHGVGQIAEELGVSRKTVETHCEHIKPSSAALMPKRCGAALVNC
jgi:FixJ family two-component response regulator